MFPLLNILCVFIFLNIYIYHFSLTGSLISELPCRALAELKGRILHVSRAYIVAFDRDLKGQLLKAK
jgi:hypothetical protein